MRRTLLAIFAFGLCVSRAHADATPVLDGTPSIPPALQSRLQQYLETRSAMLEDVSSDGKQLLITTRFGETSQVHRVTTPLGMREQLTFGREPIAQAALTRTGDSESFYYRTDKGGNENYQIYRYDAAGTHTRLTDGVSRNPEYIVSSSGRKLVYTSNARNGRDLDIWLSDGQSKGELLLEVSGDWHALEFNGDETKLLLSEYVSIADSRIYVLDLATKALTRISPESPRAADRDAFFSKDGSRVYISSDRFSEYVQLYETRLSAIADANRWRPMTRLIPWNVEHAALASDGKTIGFVTNEDGRSVLYTMDARTTRPARAAGLPVGVITRFKAASRAPLFAMSIGTSTSTSDVYVFGLKSKKLVRWTTSELGGLQPQSLTEPTSFRYRSFDGKEIPCFLYKPRNATGKMATVILIHGGPEGQSRPTFSPPTQYLASEAGIAVLVPNVRGSNGYGKTYLSLDNGDKREDSVKDIGALLDWIATQPDLDAARVAVYGGSYGGYMVLASLTTYPTRIRAGVDLVGIANFISFLERTAPYRRDLRRMEYGDERDPAMRQLLTRISPLSNVSRIRSALFVAHGANDPRVPVAEAEQIVAAVRQAGHPVWYMLAPDEGHGFQKKGNRDTFTALSMMFLEQQLLSN